MVSNVLTAVLTLFVWVVTFCAVPVPTHACCIQPETHHLKATMPCCVAQPVAPAQAKASAPGVDAPPVLASALPGADLLLNDLQVAQRQSIIDSRHVADQSGRHLELSVLLN